MKKSIPLQNRCSKIEDKILEGDKFATQFQFNLPGGKPFYSTWFGCFLSVMVVLSILFYGFMQSIKLLSFDETDIMVSKKDAHFDNEYVYSDNLMFSFGLTHYDSNPEPVDDPSYGNIVPYYKSWGIDSSVKGVKWEKLETRPCTLSEFHVRNETDPNSNFYEPHINSGGDIDFYFKKLNCL